MQITTQGSQNAKASVLGHKLSSNNSVCSQSSKVSFRSTMHAPHNLQGPPSTASIEAAAAAASKESPDPEIRGDPRMNRAVQAKLKNPHISLSDALRIGGFHYPPRATASAADNENVTLGQRKNQLNRRLRQARLNQAAAYERAMSDAGSVCGSVASVGTSVSGSTRATHTTHTSGVKRPNTFFQGNEAQKRQAFQGTLNNVLGGQQQPPLITAVEPLTVAPPATPASTATHVSEALIGQPPALLDQLLHMQSLQQTPAANLVNNTSTNLLQQQLANFQQQEQHNKPLAPVLVQAQQQLQQQVQQQPVAQTQVQVAVQQLLSSAASVASNHSNQVSVSNGPTAVNLGNNQYLLVPVPQAQAPVAVAVAPEPTATTATALANLHASGTTSGDFSGYTAVTASTTNTAPAAHAAQAPQDCSDDEDDEDDDVDADGDEEIEDDRLQAGLQIFGNEIQNLYQSAMLRAGFNPEDINENNQTYHNFAFHAWRRECQNLQKIIRRDKTTTPAPAPLPMSSSNRSVASHHSHHSNAQQNQQVLMSSNRSVASHHSNAAPGPAVHMMSSSNRSVVSHHSHHSNVPQQQVMMSSNRSVASHHSHHSNHPQQQQQQQQQQMSSNQSHHSHHSANHAQV